jgi:hydrogenase-4 component F
MHLMLPGVVISLPFASAALLACIASWRAGVWINAASTSLLFVLTCLLPWQLHTVLPAHLALLTGFVAMTTSWYGWRDVRTALAARRLDRRRTRLHHVAFQVLLGAILLALLSESPAVTWLGTAIAVAAAASLTAATPTPEAQSAAGLLLLLCGVGLMLALFGTQLLYLAAGPDAPSLRWSTARLHLAPSNVAVFCLVLGYGGVAGLVPLHSWLADATAEGTVQGATLIGALLANVPLFVILRLRSAMAGGPDAHVTLLVVLGLATLLLAALCLSARPGVRRALAFASSAQVGIVLFAFGLGGRAATAGGLVLATMLTLARASALRCAEGTPAHVATATRAASVLVFAGLPILALFLLVGATVDYSPWVLPALVAGTLLSAGSLFGGLPASTTAGKGATVPGLLELATVWLQLALVVLLVAAMPGPVVGWFRAMAEPGG